MIAFVSRQTNRFGEVMVAEWNPLDHDIILADFGDDVFRPTIAHAKTQLAANHKPRACFLVNRSHFGFDFRLHLVTSSPINAFISAPYNDAGTVTLISDTMHGETLDEIRYGKTHYYFNPPGLGPDRSGVMSTPAISRLMQREEERKRVFVARQFPSVIGDILQRKRDPQAKLTFMYGIHNELIDGFPHLLGQTREFIKSLEEHADLQHPVVVFSPNRKEDLEKALGSGQNHRVISLDQLKNRPLPSGVSVVPTGRLSNLQFDGLISVADLPVLVEGNSAVSESLKLGSPFLMLRSGWNGAMIHDFTESSQCFAIEEAYQKLIPQFQRIFQHLNQEGSAAEREIYQLIQANTRNFPIKLNQLIELSERMKRLEESALSYEESGPAFLELSQWVKEQTSDRALEYSIIRDAYQRRLISEQSYQAKVRELREAGVDVDQLQARFIPNRPNFTLKIEMLNGQRVEEVIQNGPAPRQPHPELPSESEQIATIKRELRAWPKRDLSQDPIVQQYLRNHKVYVSMTTSPVRISKIEKVLEMLDLRFIEKIFINLPQRFGRDGSRYTIPESLLNHPKVKILRIGKDLGPITKILPSVGYLKNQRSHDPQSLVISVDDDIAYAPGMIPEMIYHSVHSHQAVVAGSAFAEWPPRDWSLDLPRLPGNSLRREQPTVACPIDFVEGYGAIAYPVGQVDVKFMKALSGLSRSCLLSDDLIISFALAIDRVPRAKVDTEYFRNTFDHEGGFRFTGGLRPLPHGMLGDALHLGAGMQGEVLQNPHDANQKKYEECYRTILSYARDPAHPDRFLTKQEIMRRISNVNRNEP